MHQADHARHSQWFLDRRRFMHIGALGGLGLSLSRYFEAQARSAPTATGHIDSCIVIYHYGGPSQLDTWDMKPSAPVEVRGEFRPISTNVPGIHVSEHLPKCAKIMDKLTVIRSMHHHMRNHNAAAVESLCGKTPLKGDLELLADDPNSFPCYGSALSYLRPGRPEVPSHVALPHVMYNVVVLPGQNAGFLGAPFNPFQITRDPSHPEFKVDELELPGDMSVTRLENRRSLLAVVDQNARKAERLVAQEAMTASQQKAFNLLHSDSVRSAFDLSRESPQMRDRYGRNTLGQSLLLARRLVESGVRFINVNDKIHNGQIANWDSHENNFNRLKDDLLPPADQAYSALIEDLHARGLLQSTLVVTLAEFGRTPKINGNRGRDHWPDVFSVVLAGGGTPGGAVYGSSDRIGGYPSADPVTPGDLAATLFWRFGLDPKTEMRDLTGRPYRLAEGEPLRKLFG